MHVNKRVFGHNRPEATPTVALVLAGELSDLCLCWILSEGAQEVAERLAGNSPCATLVEEREGLSDFGVLRLW